MNHPAHNRTSEASGRLSSLAACNGVTEITVQAGDVPAFLLKANTHVQAGERREASDLLNDDNIRPIEEMAAAHPERTDIMFILAKLFLETGRLGEAETWLRRIFEREPNIIVCRELLHICEQSINRTADAIKYAQKAMELEPGQVSHWIALGKCLLSVGQGRRGMALIQQAVEKEPDNESAGMTALWYQHHRPGGKRKDFSRGYRRWGGRYRPDTCYVTYDNDPDPGRRLRVGVLSPDFMASSAARSLEPLIDGYDRMKIEMFGYGNVSAPDAVTERFEQKLDHFRNIHGIPLAEVARRVREDRIDILMSYGGHCRNNSLGVMKCKAAPVHVDYGGIDTLGIEEINYRLTDEILDPPDTLQYYTEKSFYLPGGLAAFAPLQESPSVTRLPARKNGFVTYGSFNNNTKINEYMISVWSSILRRTRHSRFILKLLNGDEDLVRRNYLRLFEHQGITPDRIDIVGYQAYRDYLMALARVDVLLDTFPYNGCITTLEGLWMGVPIVTLCGDIYVSRVGASILNRVGLAVFVASNEEEFVAKACAFAGQTDELASIRASLRFIMLRSPLCDPGRLGREVEAALRQMWHAWCRRQSVMVTTDR